MKKWLKWWALLTKRLYKKWTFVLILVLIPVLVLCYSAATEEDSGMITIALAAEDDDSLASQVMQELRDSSQLIRYVVCDSREEAENKVRAGKADGAWIFGEDMTCRVADFIASRSAKDAFVTVLERESSVQLMLAREKLSGTLYSVCAKPLYLSFIRENVAELDDFSDEELLERYDETFVDINLFEFAELGAAQGDTKGYLMTPIRGLLAVVALLCGLATAMYYVEDTAAGTFAWVPQRRRPWVELACQMISAVNILLVVLVALALTGQTVSLGRELLLWLLYSLAVSLFSMTVRRLCGSLRLLGAAMPVLVVVMLVVCPVFFDLGVLRQVQYLFPPTYFVNAAYNGRYLLYLPVYSLALGGFYWLAGKSLKRT